MLDDHYVTPLDLAENAALSMRNGCLQLLKHFSSLPL